MTAFLMSDHPVDLYATQGGLFPESGVSYDSTVRRAERSRLRYMTQGHAKDPAPVTYSCLQKTR